MEKRLSIAQLLLLLVVLVFMALTRGSRGDESLMEHAPWLMRHWGRRHLSFSGDWMSKLTGRSRSGSRTEERYPPRESRKQSPIIPTKTPKMEGKGVKLEPDDG
jgi:hypothetical protein